MLACPGHRGPYLDDHLTDPLASHTSVMVCRSPVLDDPPETLTLVYQISPISLPRTLDFFKTTLGHENSGGHSFIEGM